MSDNKNSFYAYVAQPGTEAAKHQMDQFARSVVGVGDTTKEAGQNGQEGKQTKGGIMGAGITVIVILIVAIIVPVVAVMNIGRVMYNWIKKAADVQKKLTGSTENIKQVEEKPNG